MANISANNAIQVNSSSSGLADNPNPLFSLDSNGAPVYAARIDEIDSTSSRPLRSAYYDVESQLIRGTMSFSKDKLRELDPSYTGYTHIFVLRMPEFMTAIANGRVMDNYDKNAVATAQMHCRNLKALLELGSTSYSGTPDLTMNTSEVNTGFSERSYPAPTYSQYDGKQFTIRCLETRGEPLRRAMEYYINGISDANVKATMLHGALNSDNVTPMDPTLPNYTFALMVVQTDQTLRYIQDISVWNSCIFTQVERSHLDWENGNIDIVQPQDVQFTGVYMPDAHNDYIDALALKLIGTRLKYYRRYQDMGETEIGTNTWSSQAY